jgi:predicted transcriptional regulator
MYLDDDEVQNALQESQNRVQSMAMVHEKLYQSKNLSSIDMGDYMHQIAHHLLDNYHLKSNQIKFVSRLKRWKWILKLPHLWVSSLMNLSLTPLNTLFQMEREK